MTNTRDFLAVLVSLLVSIIGNGQTTYNENENISNIPTGISYQTGPGSNNTFNWTYPYGVKLTVSNGSCCRNFEIGTTGYQSNDESLIFRQWDAFNNVWKPWHKIVSLDQDGLIDVKGKIVIPNPNNNNANVHLSWLNNVARLRIGGSGSGATSGLDIQTTGDRSLMRLLHNGDVGIGTANPDSKLTVKGDIHAEEVKVDLSVPGPDYVFKEDYDLKSLEEVQEHIKIHGHLPNIPSALEMETNGIRLGEMNMKLLEKIEELTLYTLQQQKELEKLKELELKNQALQDRLAKLEEALQSIMPKTD